MDEPLLSGAGGETHEPLYRPPPRPRPRSVWKGCAVVGLAVGAFLGGSSLWGVYKLAPSIIDPHHELYEPESNSTAGVQPLIGLNTTFDVVISVFAQTPTPPVNTTELMDAHSEEWDTYVQLLSHLWLHGHPTPPDEEGNEPISMEDWIDWVGPLEVQPTEELYSAVVASNLTLRDKHTDFDIDLDIPKSALFSHGVYAVLTLVPRVQNLTSVEDYRDRTERPRLLGSSLGEPDGLQRKLLLSLSQEFRIVERTSPRNATLLLADSIHAVILNKTRPMRSVTFWQRFETLRKNGCNVPGMEGKQHRVACNSEYANVGTWGTRYGLWPWNTTDGTEAPKVAKRPLGHSSEGPFKYAPFVGLLPTPPLQWKAVHSAEDTLRHRLHLRLSVVPQRAIAAFKFAGWVGMLQNEHRSKDDHWRHRGHDRHDALTSLLGLSTSRKGWVRLASSTVSELSDAAAWTLELLYWYTRLTSTGLSIKATALLAAQQIQRAAGAWVLRPRNSGWLVPVYVSAIASALAWFQLRAFLPYTWAGGLKRVPPTKRERLSARRDVTYAQTVLLVALSLLIGYYGSTPVLRESHPLAEAQNSTSVIAHVWRAVQAAQGSAALLGQLVVNARNGTFAGSYALGTVFAALALTDDVVKLFLKSRTNYYAGLTLQSAFVWATTAVSLWQALTLPGVEQVVADEED